MVVSLLAWRGSMVLALQISAQHFDPMLRKYLGDLRLEQLPLPMHTITVDLIGGRAVVREAGDAVHAITESINIPIISKPIFRNGQALVDGGLIDNVPADVLTRMGLQFCHRCERHRKDGA